MDEPPISVAGQADDVPTPPWLQPERMPRRMRMPLSQEAVVDAALALITEEGLDKLTMRRVADRLEVSPGALYVHVRNKEELLQLTLDRVMAELSLPRPDPQRWAEQIKEFARATRALLTRYPAVAQMSFGQIPSGPNAVVVFEGLLAILAAGGLPGRAAAYAADLVSGYVKSAVYEANVWREADAGGTSVEKRLDQAREYLSTLPAERFPNLTTLAGPMYDASPDDRFEFGLEVLVGGLTRLTGREPGGSPA